VGCGILVREPRERAGPARDALAAGRFPAIAFRDPLADQALRDKVLVGLDAFLRRAPQAFSRQNRHACLVTNSGLGDEAEWGALLFGVV